MNPFFWRELRDSTGAVFSQPFMLAVSIFWSWCAVGIVIWLPNIELITAVLRNQSLGWGSRLSFGLEMYQLVFKFFGGLQLSLVVLFIILSALAFGLFLQGLRYQHRNVISRAESNPALLGSVVSTGVSMIGLMLLVPVATTSGLVFGFNLHLPGVIITLIGLTGLLWSISRLSACIHLARMAR